MRPENLSESSTTILSPPLALRRSASRSSVPEPTSDRSDAKKVGGLVLTRHINESIMIGNEVEVEVVGLKSGSVRLRIIAPRSIAVHRREVYDEIQVNPLPEKFVTPSAVEGDAMARPDRPERGRGGLVLTRSAHQSIMIGDEVELAVVEVRPATVKIKIMAPRTVEVHRREIYLSIQDGQLLT